MSFLSRYALLAEEVALYENSQHAGAAAFGHGSQFHDPILDVIHLVAPFPLRTDRRSSSVLGGFAGLQDLGSGRNPERR